MIAKKIGHKLAPHRPSNGHWKINQQKYSTSQ